MTTSRIAIRPILVVALAAATVLTACSAAGPAPATGAAPTASAGPTALPSAGPPSSDGGSGGAGGGSAGDPGSGVPVEPPLNPNPVDPGAGQPILVRPLPGRANPHPVAAVALQASVDGRHVIVKISWYGGIEPCSVLDSVTIQRSGTDIVLTPVEGSSDPTAICPEIALLKATIVDLGELEPGTWRIAAGGSTAVPIEITIT